MSSTVPASDIAVKFPSSIWEEIFRHLSVPQLLEFRLICRNWRTLIDGCPTLMKRILLRFPAEFVLDREYEPDYLVPASNLALDKVRISAVNTWWPEFAERLEFLNLTECKVSAGTLLQLLKPMANLKFLRISNMTLKMSSRLSVNIRLNQMETLAMQQLNKDTMHFLAPIFTQLKRIEFPAEIGEGTTVEFLRSFKSTLEGLTVDYTPVMLNEILQLKLLTHLTIRTGAMSDQTLTAIGEELPNLRSINVRLSEDTSHLTFLNTMPELEEICLTSAKSTTWNFADAVNPKLIKLRLSSCKPNASSLYSYLENSPHVTDICFVYCQFPSWTEVFDVFELYCHTLERLELNSVTVASAEDRLSEYFDSLRDLNLQDCKMSTKLLLAVVSLCPALEEVHVNRMYDFSNQAMLALCKNAKHLGKLTVNRGVITEYFADYVVEHCHALKQLTVLCYNCYSTLLSDTKVKLKELKNIECQFV